jgi:hypothetical protein
MLEGQSDLVSLPIGFDRISCLRLLLVRAVHVSIPAEIGRERLV